jgi:protein translocation Sec62 family protein
VSKIDGDAPGHEGHNHAKKKHVKGQWDVKIEQHQEANDDNYYIWLYEGSQWKQKLYAGGALLLVIAIVLFPLWPLVLRQGVWYVSMGMLGLIGLFFAMAIVRLILFIITMFTAAPGLWLYPNLFEDVGFFDSFRPVWAWHEVSNKSIKRLHQFAKTNVSRPLKTSRRRSGPRRKRKPPSKLPKPLPTGTLSRRARRAAHHQCPQQLFQYKLRSRPIPRLKLLALKRRPRIRWCNGSPNGRLWRKSRKTSRRVVSYWTGCVTLGRESLHGLAGVMAPTESVA